MIALISAFLLNPEWVRKPLDSPLPNSETVVLRSLVGALSPAKVSPSGAWSFDQTTVVALGQRDGDLDRIRVFGQSNNSAALLNPERAGHLLARLFDFNYNGLKLDHSPEFNRQRVDVYLCSAGLAGGQQRYDQDPDEKDEYRAPSKVNTMYVFQIATLTDKIEACREVAHEYGHATLPPVKIKGGREEWANGHLGERIYLKYLQQQLMSGKLKPEDMIGASAQDIQAYLARKFEPLTQKLAGAGPDTAVLTQESDNAFSAYLSLACYAYEVLPLEVFRRTLVLNPDQSPKGYGKALLEAVSERKVVALQRPHGLKNQDWWVPLGKGQIVGAKVLETKSAWAKIRPNGRAFIKNVVSD